MFLSLIHVDVGTNPDGPRPGRVWLRNLYRIHQRLCMAFPSASRKSDDPDFLKPFKPEDFCPSQVQVARGTDAGFLFRIDPQLGGDRTVILVQSAVKPDWDYAFHNAGHLLAAWPDEPRPVQVSLGLGARFRFRLTANPTRKTGTILKSERLAMKERGTKDPKRNGCRVPVRAEEYGQWLVARSEAHGFRLVEPLEDTLHTEARCVYVNKTHDSGKGQRLRSVSYDGLLEIADTARFREALRSGIRPAKAFGFGLLSIAPVNL